MISLDRRKAQRFSIIQPLTFRSLENGGGSGYGRTINLASRGILFETEAPLGCDSQIEVAIDWPAKLDSVSALKLIARGRVVRVDQGRVALRLESYEFRTVGRGIRSLLKRSASLEFRVPQQSNRNSLFLQGPGSSAGVAKRARQQGSRGRAP